MSASGSSSSSAGSSLIPLRPTEASHAPAPVTSRRTCARPPPGTSRTPASKRSARAVRLSGGAAFVGTCERALGLVLGKRPAHALGHADRLLAALGLDGELGDYLVPPAPDVFDGHHLGLAPQLGSDGDRRREAHLVPSVVDAELVARRLDQLLPEAVD